MRVILKVLAVFLLTLKISHAAKENLVITPMPSPIPVQTMHKQLLVYEIHMINIGETPRRINRIEVRDEKHQLLESYDLQRLAHNSIVYQDNKMLPNNPITLQKNTAVIIYMWIELKKNETVPHQLLHEIWSVSSNNDKSQAFVQTIKHTISVREEALPVLSAPLKGNHWVVVNAMDNNANHRRTFSIHNNKPMLDQRFAIDWEKIDANGFESRGNMHELTHWHAYGEPVLAGVDGKVVNMADALQDNIPPDAPNPKPSKADIPGNFVVLEFQQYGKKYYVFYAHLKSGSIKVRLGEQVKAGQILGFLGNTGNSGLPHLHMHVMDGKTPLKSNGIPFVFDHFMLEGNVKVLDLDFGIFLPEFYRHSQSVERVIPVENSVLRF